MGKAADAVSICQRAISHLESTRSLVDTKTIGSNLSVYASMIRAFIALGNVEEAFNYSERARPRIFLDLMGFRKAVANNVAKKERGLPSLMAVEPLNLKRLQDLLGPGQTLLQYLVTRERTLLWVVNKQDINGLSISISREDLISKVTSLRLAISKEKSLDEYQKAAMDLYTLLIQPALPHIKGKEIIIVPHGVLQHLPFQALYSPPGKYLIEEFSLSYVSSASLLQFTTAKGEAKGERLLAFGNPYLGDLGKDLEFAEMEVRQVQRLYPQSTVFVRKEATEEKSKALSPQYDILHFAAHAELREDDPLSSAILLAKDGTEDGRLEVREIFEMDLKANLVVLSACETGLGKLLSGDDLVGLTTAFIFAGTPSVVASLWKVEDDTTAALMASFYKNLRTMSKVEALRQAQLELIRGEGRSDLLARRGVGGIGKLGEVPEAKPPSSMTVSTSHPYFWAPFILVGDGK
jgi:CHAT domain-containing protein